MSKQKEKEKQSLRVAFIHPDLGIGGAERLVVDAALGLQQLGHHVDLYTSHHDPGHCFEETRDGTLNVHYVKPPFPRSVKGKFHILFAHARQLHLTTYLLSSKAPSYDVYFVDQLSTCVPFLRLFGHTRVVFYCHFPDKLLANGAFIEGQLIKNKPSFLKSLYRMPMDWLEEITTGQADTILANSLFTARVFKAYFPSISQLPRVVYPGINLSAYDAPVDIADPEIMAVISSRPTLLSLNRFEGKKNAMLALQAFALLIIKRKDLTNLRLVLAGGYDPRLEDNVQTLNALITSATSLSLSYTINSRTPIPPSASHLTPNQTREEEDPQVLFLLNFTTAQRTALLQNSNTLALLYTPANEHFGIVPIEAMACGLPVLACDSGGPTESILATPYPSPLLPTTTNGKASAKENTGWLRPPILEVWAEAIEEIVSLSKKEKEAIKKRARTRARSLFGMEAMAKGLEEALKEAEGMGRVGGLLQMVDMYELLRTVLLMAVGFLVAYFAAPFLIPNI